jgi:hypothetical protein
MVIRPPSGTEIVDPPSLNTVRRNLPPPESYAAVGDSALPTIATLEVAIDTVLELIEENTPVYADPPEFEIR